MKIKVPYYPGQKVRLVSGSQGWIKSINIYERDIIICVWDGLKDSIYVELWQIESIVEGSSIGLNLSLGKK